jgi:hypothetical protein
MRPYNQVFRLGDRGTFLTRSSAGNQNSLKIMDLYCPSTPLVIIVIAIRMAGSMRSYLAYTRGVLDYTTCGFFHLNGQKRYLP